MISGTDGADHLAETSRTGDTLVGGKGDGRADMQIVLSDAAGKPPPSLALTDFIL